jgi:hypothetical protein
MSDDPILALIARAKRERDAPPPQDEGRSFLDMAAGVVAKAKRKLKGDKPADDGDQVATIGIRG